MKQIIRLSAVFMLLACLCACHYNESGDILEPVEFFYPRKPASFVYGSADGVITSESRESSGHVNDLNYLLTMYLRGPQDISLRNPFPTGCKLEEVYAEGSTLYIRFSKEFTTLENAELTLACAALSKTCFSIIGYETISIHAESDGKLVHIELNPDSMQFSDQYIPISTDISNQSNRRNP